MRRKYNIILLSLAMTMVFGAMAYSSNCCEASKPACSKSEDCWQNTVVNMPYNNSYLTNEPTMELLRQDYEKLEFGRAANKLPIQIGSKIFSKGLGTHAVSRIKISSPEAIMRFTASIGANYYPSFGMTNGSVVFSVLNDKGEVYRSAVKKVGEEPEQIDIDVKGSNVLYLNVDDGGDGPSWDHASWADAAITLKSGEVIKADELMQAGASKLTCQYPFSFKYGGVKSDELLGKWERKDQTEKIDDDRTRITISWLEPTSKLKVVWDAVCFKDFSALESILYFENTGESDTAIIEDIQSLEMYFQKYDNEKVPCRLHISNGGISNDTNFEAYVIELTKGQSRSIGASGGFSSVKNLPFYKVESGNKSTIIGIGWSGQWQSTITCREDGQIDINAGMEKTHFLLHPGEKVRMPRILILHSRGDTLESNAQFRQLIYKHYCATRNGKKMLPTPYCNTCFTRGGGWLNETTAENQISLINAYAALGAEAVLTDAGWFEGGWPEGAGNWTPRKDHYPDGMGPVAAAAKAKGIIYGLWFEPERVMEGTWLHKNHPDWLLKSPDNDQISGREMFVLNFGLPEAQEYFFNIVKGFMELPGFRVYRQDFNVGDVLKYWQNNDTPDRQGITEIKYILGLYSYWERIAENWPDSFRIECAGGGRRIDLETIMRMHTHQKSDWWFHNHVDLAGNWTLSQYLPNNVFMCPINRLDDYTFHSAMQSSLNFGWIADDAHFDTKRAKKLVDRYRQIRHLMIGAWYPLTGYSRESSEWIGSQYHRPDINEGMVVVSRGGKSPYQTLEANLRGLDSKATYEISSDLNGTSKKVKGSELMNRFPITLSVPNSSDILVYKKAAD